MWFDVFSLEENRIIGRTEKTFDQSKRSKCELLLYENLIKEGKKVEIPFFMGDEYTALVDRRKLIHIAVDSEDERRAIKARSLKKDGRLTVIILRDDKTGDLIATF